MAHPRIRGEVKCTTITPKEKYMAYPRIRRVYKA